MEFKADKAWLERKLARADDAEAAAGGTSFDALKKQVERRTVTPGAIAAAQTELGKAIRFVREKKGLTRQELAEAAKLGDDEIEAIELRHDYQPSLRAIIYLADALDLSRDRLKELAGYVSSRDAVARPSPEHRFAANSKTVDGISDDEYEAVRALVEVLSERK